MEGIHPSPHATHEGLYTPQPPIFSFFPPWFCFFNQRRLFFFFFPPLQA